MTQTAIPFLFMRGGSSRGPYMRSADLPADLDKLADVLAAAVGSGHPLNIDGIGGGNAVTTKTAMLSVSDDDWADIDYFFAQVSVEDGLVDFKPTCGNILVGVGPAAIEMGLIKQTILSRWLKFARSIRVHGCWQLCRRQMAMLRMMATQPLMGCREPQRRSN